MSQFVVRHPRTKLFLADNPSANDRYLRRGGVKNAMRWVRTHAEAKAFASYADAELPCIWANLDDPEVCPLLSCGLVGDPITRDHAIAIGVFHAERSRAQPHG